MKAAEMKKFQAHCDKYFDQTDSIVLHPANKSENHIDILRYPPSEKYPFWKVVTMGACDYKMPHEKVTLSDRNEYMMFISPSLNLTDSEEAFWYYNILLSVARYPRETQTVISYGHSIEWGESEEDCDMTGAFIEMPCMISDTGILHCKLGFMKKVACLQVITLTAPEIRTLMKVGPQAFSDYLYPDGEEGRPHFLCEKKRTELF